jgi:hypothetical protein
MRLRGSFISSINIRDESCNGLMLMVFFGLTRLDEAQDQ